MAAPAVAGRLEAGGGGGDSTPRCFVGACVSNLDGAGTTGCSRLPQGAGPGARKGRGDVEWTVMRVPRAAWSLAMGASARMVSGVLRAFSP